jgi:hypothetical protein
VGDTWRIKRNFSLNFGVHYVRDTGRTDSQVPPIPELNQWGAGLGDRIRNPNTNFGPQVGFAWDLKGNGKTVIRGGGGLLYENAVWNNLFFEAPARFAKGIFAYTPLVCYFGSALPFNWPSDPGTAGTLVGSGAGVSNGDGTVSPTFCGNTIASSGAQVLALSSAFQAASTAAGLQVTDNPNYVGTNLSAAGINGLDLFAERRGSA